MFTLWTLYQALKLLERHAILNQRCKNWVGVIIPSGLIMDFRSNVEVWVEPLPIL